MLNNGTSAARRPKVGSGGAPIPNIGGGGASKLLAARRVRRKAIVSTLLLPRVVFDILPPLFQFPSSSSQIYRLLNCLQIQSKTHIFLGESISGP